MSTSTGVCLHEDLFAELRRGKEEDRRLLGEIHARMYKDNGKPSIQSALINGETRMLRIEDRLGDIERSLDAHTGSLNALAAQLTQYQHATGASAASEEELENKVLHALERVTKGVGGRFTTVAWVCSAIIVATPCVTVLAVKFF